MKQMTHLAKKPVFRENRLFLFRKNVAEGKKFAVSTL